MAKKTKPKRIQAESANPKSDPPKTAQPRTTARKRRAPLKLRGLPPDEQIGLLSAEIDRVRRREEARLIRIARKAGYFKRRIPNAELLKLLTPGGGKTPKSSQLYRLENTMARTKSKATEEERRLDTRRKILLGSFLIAQIEHKPEIRAMVEDELEQFLDLHRDPKVAAANKALLKDFLTKAPGNAKPGTA